MMTNSKVTKKMGRRTKSDSELWDRRVNVIKRFARGDSITEIAKRYGVAWKVIQEDIKAYEDLMLKLEKSGIKADKIRLREVCRLAILAARKTNNPAGKAGLLGKAIEATKEISILSGSRDVEGSGKTFIGGSLEELKKKFDKVGKD